MLAGFLAIALAATMPSSAPNVEEQLLAVSPTPPPAASVVERTLAERFVAALRGGTPGAFAALSTTGDIGGDTWESVRDTLERYHDVTVDDYRVAPTLLAGEPVIEIDLRGTGIRNNAAQQRAPIPARWYLRPAAGGAPTDNNVSGTVTITNNKLLTAHEHGVDIQNYSGTISNNLIQSATSAASSSGSGIRLLGFGSAGGTSNITTATISSNTINYFPAGAGITAQYGNSAGTGGTWGTPHSGTNLITISNNTISGFSAAVPVGTNAILATLAGNGQAAWSITGNTASLVSGTYIGVDVAGTAPVTSCDIKNNILNGMLSSGAQTISYAISDVSSPSEAPTLTGTISGNTISGQDGTGIFAEATSAVSGSLSVTISGNNVAAPSCGGCGPPVPNKFGIEVTSGLSTTVTGTPTACFKVVNNISAGEGVDTGIGWVKRTGCTFNVDSFPSPGTDPTSYINGLNPSGGGVTRVVGGSTAGACTAP